MTGSLARGQTRKLSVAPMMDLTDRHFRRILRALTGETLLYTEMITTEALLRGDPAPLLAFDPIEHPIAIQLGGDDPKRLAEAAKMAEAAGYDEVNLNVGCPSDRVQKGRIGAVLMDHADLVAEAVAAMKASVRLPVTVKHRIGIDDHDSYAFLLGFVDTVAKAGADRFTVHARKAWLSGLSPKENRSIPPLCYPRVHQLKADRPHLSIEINGGIQSLEAAKAELTRVDAVMIGRAAYEDPMLLAEADGVIFGEMRSRVTAKAAIQSLEPYIAAHLQRGGRLHHVSRHLLGFFKGAPGARRYRQILSVDGSRPGAGLSVLKAALDAVSDAAISEA